MNIDEKKLKALLLDKMADIQRREYTELRMKIGDFGDIQVHLTISAHEFDFIGGKQNLCLDVKP